MKEKHLVKEKELEKLRNFTSNIAISQPHYHDN